MLSCLYLCYEDMKIAASRLLWPLPLTAGCGRGGMGRGTMMMSLASIGLSVVKGGTREGVGELFSYLLSFNYVVFLDMQPVKLSSR